MSTSSRGLIVSISNEALIPLQSIPSTSSSFSADLTNLAPLIKESEPAYIILRRYADATDGYIAVTYVPDTAAVRQKMLFASTRLTLVRELGTEHFRDTLFATRADELTASGFAKHDKHEQLVAPLSVEELSLQEAKQAEADASRGTTTRAAHASIGVSFPIKDAALSVLRALKDGGVGVNLVQLKIDTVTEEIDLVGGSTVEVGGLAGEIAQDEPRYSFFRYDHEYAGKPQSSVVFIYTCPGTSKPKERMLYSCVKSNMIKLAEETAGLRLDKKVS